MSQAKTLRQWQARRAGGGITIYGENIDNAQQDRITNVRQIEPPQSAAEHHVLATDAAGTVHKLIFT
jgi:hypothetical protein